MKVRLAAPRRGSVSSSLRIYPIKIRAALLSAGVDAVEIYPIEMGAEGARGGVWRPTLRMLTGRLPRDGSVWHASEPNSALRGLDVVTIHDFHAFENPGLMMRTFRWVTRLSARRARRIIVESAVVRDDVRRYLGAAAADRTRIVPPPYKAPARGRLPDRFDVLWLGSAVRRKHPEIFLRELAASTQGRLRVAFVCHPGGEGREREVREGVDAARRVHDVTVWTDDLPLDELDRLYRSARTLVSTSSLEGYHVPVVEAWSRGTWIVLPRIPPYTQTFAAVEGVRFYEPSAGFVGTLHEALRSPPFEPSAALLESVSDAAVGRRLWEIYREVRPELPVPPATPKGVVS